MSYQEKQSLVALLSHVFGSIGYFYYRFQGIDATTPLDFQFWASTTLLYLLVLVVFRIIIAIIFAIINAIITRENAPDNMDEMDRLIDMRATLNFYHTFAIGFFLSIGTQVLNWPHATMFLGFMLSMVIGGIVAEFSNFYFYRKGVY
jgi:hypothetical protein